jgi:heme exporter protein D
MDSLLTHFVTLIFSNDSNAVIAVLVLVIIGLIIDRRRIITENAARELRNEKMQNDNTEAFINSSADNVTVLTSLRMMIAELIGRRN